VRGGAGGDVSAIYSPDGCRHCSRRIDKIFTHKVRGGREMENRNGGEEKE
jgi:hypothetical protein